MLVFKNLLQYNFNKIEDIKIKWKYYNKVMRKSFNKDQQKKKLNMIRLIKFKRKIMMYTF